MPIYKKATEGDLKRFLDFMEKWGRKLGRVEWAVTGQLCDCGDAVHAHLLTNSRAHTALVKLHDIGNDLENTALHEQLHIEMAEMAHVIGELARGRITEEGYVSREHCLVAQDWYDYYADCFIDKMTNMLLGIDKEIRSLKRKIRKMERAG